MSNIDFKGITFPPETEFDVEVLPNQIILTVITQFEPQPMAEGENDAEKTEEDQPL